MEPPTKPMMKEAIEAGFYQPPGVSGAKIDRYPRIQILTIEDLLAGKKVEYPRNVEVDATYKKSPTRPQSRRATNVTLRCRRRG